MPRSISGDSVAASSVFYLHDEYDVLPGRCKTCCLRCAFPSLISSIILINGVVGFGVFAILAGDTVDKLFYDINSTPQEFYSNLERWNGLIKWIVGAELAVMTIIAIVMLALGCLATGSVRKEFVCRFKSKTAGRCQTFVFMIIVYFLWFVWLIQSIFFTVPVVFFLVLNRGVCSQDGYDGVCPLNLRMWALAEDDSCISKSEVTTICESNSLLYVGIALAFCLLVVFALTQILINSSANYSHLRSRYKKIYNGRNSGTYTLSRNGSIRNSRRNLAGSRSTVAATTNSDRNPFPTLSSTDKMPYAISGSERNSFRSAVVNDGFVHDHRNRNNGSVGGVSSSVIGYGGHDSSTMNTLGHDSIGLSSLRAPSTHSGSTGIDYAAGGNASNPYASSDRLMYRTEYAV